MRLPMIQYLVYLYSTFRIYIIFLHQSFHILHVVPLGASDFKAAYSTSLFFSFKSDLHPDLPSGIYFPFLFLFFKYFLIFPSYLKFFCKTVILGYLFQSGWLKRNRKTYLNCVSTVCAQLYFTTAFIFVIIIFENNLELGIFWANLHLKLPFVESRDIEDIRIQCYESELLLVLVRTQSSLGFC